MATYDYSHDQLAGVIDDSGVFSHGERDEILQALQNAGVFSSTSSAGPDAHVAVLSPDQAPSAGDEVVIYTGAPDHPLELDPNVHAYAFATNDAVTVSIDGMGNDVLVTGGGDDV